MNPNFKVVQNPHIYHDLQHFVNYYRRESGNSELGKRFMKIVKHQIKKLNNSALQYSIKYDEVRCMPIPPFPYLIHYRVKNNTVFVEAIIHTSEDSNSWSEKTKRPHK